MTKIFSCLVCVFVLVLAVSVWQQLNPTTQHQIVLLWSSLVRFLANTVERLVAS